MRYALLCSEMDSSWSGCEESHGGTGSLTGAEGGVAGDDCSRHGGSQGSTPGEACGAVACHHDASTPSLANSVGDRAGIDDADNYEDVGDELCGTHCHDDVLVLFVVVQRRG
jgi:hypothetical protein